MSSMELASQIVISLDQRRLASAKPSCRGGSFGDGSSTASQAFSAFNVLQQTCTRATASVNAANFGPFANSGSCTYDCGFMEQTWNWNADFTSSVKGNTFIPALVQMAPSSGFATAFAPSTKWVTTDLPAFSTNVANDFNVINQTDAAIIKAGGAETPAQKAALADAFSDALSQVHKSLEQANVALQSVAIFVTQQSGNDGYLQALNKSTQSWVDTSIVNGADNLIGKIACGAGDVQNQFNAMQSVVDGSFVSLLTPFGIVNVQFQTALATVSSIAGVFLVLQTKSDSVTEQLNLAQGYPPTSPLRTIHLNNAARSWSDLVAYAQAQLST